MGLHMHSTKTCCAPCEYTLVGLMNDREGLIQDGVRIGFLENFRASSTEHRDFTFSLPEASDFKMLVTVTASEHDATHQKQPSYTAEQRERDSVLSAYKIFTKHPAT